MRATFLAIPIALIFATTATLSAAQTAPTTSTPAPKANGKKPKSDAKKGDAKTDAKDAAPPAPPPPPPEPPPPPPIPGPPTTSTSGAQLIPVTPPPPVQPAVDPAFEQAQDAKIKSLEARLQVIEDARAHEGHHANWHQFVSLDGTFIQPQFLWQGFNAAASPNATGGQLPAGVTSNGTIANTSGTTTNPDYFRLRRARLRITITPLDTVRMVLEFDPTPAGGTVGGTGTIARNVEADGIVHWGGGNISEYGMGIFKVPFGYEVLQSDADRPFIERSWVEQNLFPGEYDTGVKVYSHFLKRRATVNLAVVNGITEGEKTFSLLPDLNKGKDLVGRVNYNFGPADVGVSGYYGEGQNVDATALRFKQFKRYAGNLEVAFHHSFSKELGMTRVYAEGTLGQNMDRGTKYAFALPAIPTDITANVTNRNEQAVWFRVEQDITHWATAGFRFDDYNPDTSQKLNHRNTYAFLAVAHINRYLQWMNEFDHAIDNIHAMGTPAPGKHIETFSSVLQARF